MGDMMHFPDRELTWTTVVASIAVSLAITAMVILLGDAGLLAVWSFPTGAALGLLVRPKAGAIFRIFALAVGFWCGYHAFASARQLGSVERLYAFAAALIILPGAAWFTFRPRFRNAGMILSRAQRGK